jgi:hypothetical protein
MSFILIKGTFHILGKQPDGDSVRFKADNKIHWKKLTTETGIPITKDLTSKTDSTVQLRIEAIDALETHYQNNHQPMALAKDATLHILSLLGFKNVKLGPSEKDVISVDKDGIEGYILTRYIDNPTYGRPVSYAFAGKTNFKSGQNIRLETATARNKKNPFVLLENSANYKMMQSGLVYPIYYNTLFFDLRNAMNKALKAARDKKKNLWHPTAGDKTNNKTGFNATKLVDLENKEIIFPKLFRRLADFHNAKSLGYSKTLKNFKEKFLPPKGDMVEIMSINHTTDALDFLIEVIGSTKLRLKYLPEDLKFFQPKPKKK